ncbi:MAG: hypothetical protein QOJ69_152, partial [Actinomycetota bacterium]|nr:hypothetical protein [Actinomycetota bacterium]
TQLLDKAIIIEGGEGGGVVANGSIVSLRYQGDDDVGPEPVPPDDTDLVTHQPASGKRKPPTRWTVEHTP